MVSVASEVGQGGGECRLGSLLGTVPLSRAPSLPALHPHAAFYESESGSLAPLEFWKSEYFSRLEEDEKLAVPICSLFFKSRVSEV